MKEERRRIHLLDEIRGFAIIAMIFHHAFLDIGDVLGIEWGYETFDKLCVFQPVFWAAFIIISGICSRLSRNTLKRGLIVLGAGMAVTVATAVVMPALGWYGSEIYFGILHCLGSCMIITGLLMPVIKKIPPLAGMAVCTALFLLTYSVSSGSLLYGLIKLPPSLYTNDALAPLGFYSPSFASADYFALLPWLFMFLFGAFFGKYAAEGRFPEFAYKKRCAPLAFTGKNSLWFYLGHQVVIYAVLFAVLRLFFKE